jgi:hypothetical protein
MRSGPQLPQIYNNIYVNTSNIRDIGRASDLGSGLYTRDATVDQAQAYYNALSPAMRGYFEAVGKQTNSNGRGIYNDYVDRSSELASMGVYKDPITLFWEDMGPNGNGPIGSDSSSSGGGGYYGGGGGSYSGTSSTTVLSNREDARVMIDSLALKMIGRTVNEAEFEDYYQALLSAEKSNPTVVTQAGDSVTQQSGLGAAGREQVLTEAFRENDDYADFQVGGRMVDMFQEYLSERGVFNG